MEIQNLYSRYQQSKGVCIDTRKLKKGEIFFALIAENDGHNYVNTALEKGASSVVVSKKVSVSKTDEAKVFRVPDTLLALQQLANYHRHTLLIPIIGIAGSNGKTTTKDLVTNVLSQKYSVCATRDNENNHIGVPLTILRISKKHDIAVVELGTNHSGELDVLCDITDPSHGILVSIGKEHLEGFANLAGVVHEEMAILRSLAKNQGILFLNTGIKEVTKKYLKGIKNLVAFGSTKNNFFMRETKGFPNFSGTIIEGKKKISVNSKLVGTWNTDNILGAYTIGRFFDVSQSDCVKAIAAYQPHNFRSESIQWKKRLVVLDAYNANPTSMELVWADVSKLKQLSLCIVGAMKETGKYESIEHKGLVNKIHKLKIENSFFVGAEFAPHQKLIQKFGYNFFATVSDCKKHLNENLPDPKTLIVVKGSKGAHLWEIFDKKFE